MIASKAEVVTAVFTAIGALAALATFTVLVVAAVFASRQVNEAKRARQTTMMIELSNRWNGDPLVSARRVAAAVGKGNGQRLQKRFVKLYNSNRVEAYSMLRVPDFFEDLAILEHEEAIPLTVVRETYGTAVQQHWKYWKPTVEHLRRVQPTLYEMWGKLVAELQPPGVT